MTGPVTTGRPALPTTSTGSPKFWAGRSMSPTNCTRRSRPRHWRRPNAPWASPSLTSHPSSNSNLKEVPMTTIAPALPATSDITAEVHKSLQAIGVDPALLEGPRETRTPITGEVILATAVHNDADIEAAISTAAEAFKTWRNVPAPVRGAVVKRWGQLLTEHKEDVAALITAKEGKIL